MSIFTVHISVIYAVIVWAFAFLFLKPKRIKELFPIAILAFVILFLAEEYLITLGLFQFNNPFLPVHKIPLFHLLWGAGSGIVVMHYMKKEFHKKTLIILLFAIITLGFEYVSESIGSASHLGNFTEVHDAFQDLVTLTLLVSISEGLWGRRIYSNFSNSETQETLAPLRFAMKDSTTSNENKDSKIAF